VVFGLGTIPLMTTAIWIGNLLSGKVMQHIKKAVPVFLAIIAVMFILRGLGLGIPYVSPKDITEQANSKYECH
ncbi:sulfite exporter TauE/SafE family protein, partial [Zunongwangia sp. F117]|nr:sulfite exporter TauE/SafE family protein [Zunongwangia sp. F117]